MTWLPILVFEHVAAVDQGGLRGTTRGRLLDVSGVLGPGVHAVLGSPEDGSLAFLDAVTGRRTPLRGRVLVGGQEPSRSAATRGRIGSLFADPILPDARTVGDAVTTARRARGEADGDARAVLEPFGLGALIARKRRSLAFPEARAVELAIALTTPAPLLVVLHEPLADVSASAIAVVRERAHELANAGAAVVVVTSSPADARALGDRIYVLSKGVLLRSTPGDGAGLGGATALLVWLADPAHARALARALVARPEIEGLAVSAGAGGPTAVRIEGVDLDACAVAVAEESARAGASIEAIASVLPTLEDVRVASDAYVRALRAPSPPRPAAGGPR